MDPIRSWPPHLRKIERQGTPVIWTMDGTNVASIDAAGSFNPGSDWEVII